MRIGLTVYDLAAAELVELARAADELGFDDLWLGEHIVAPIDYGSEHPTTGTQEHRQHRGRIVDPTTVLLDPLVALAAAAAVTTRLRLCTGIYLVGLRHPLVTARMTATLHDASGGRLVLGVGSGWLEEEFEALGVPFGERISRYEEALDVLRRAWAGGPFHHDGRHFRFRAVQVATTKLAIPLILGGNTGPALRRAVRVADGWFASGTPSFEDAVALRARITELRAELGDGHGHGHDDGHDDAFPLWFRVTGADPALLDRYRRDGFERVLVWANEVWPRQGTLEEKRAALTSAAERLGVVRPG